MSAIIASEVGSLVARLKANMSSDLEARVAWDAIDQEQGHFELKRWSASVSKLALAPGPENVHTHTNKSPPNMDMVELARAEAKYTVGDIFRSRGGHGLARHAHKLLRLRAVIMTYRGACRMFLTDDFFCTLPLSEVKGQADSMHSERRSTT